MKKLNGLSIFLVILLSCQICFSQQTTTQDTLRKAKIDSLMNTYSVEEILQYREHYQNKIEELKEEQLKLREKGIRDAEEFIANNPDSKVLDKVLIRLAELYYEVAEDEYMQKMLEYDQLLEQWDSSERDSTLTEPVKDFNTSLSLYQRIIEQFPHSELVDDAYYNKGFILEEKGAIDSALAIYRSLISEFQDSRYVPDALMRIGEYYFNPPRNDIDQAIDYYKQILAFKDSPKYDEALYRLGWSYYRLSKFPEAVSYFTLLADDIDRAKIIDPSQRFSNPTLRDESLEYIGISFLDYGGTAGAVRYLNNIGGREYGFEILKKIGDVYMYEKEMYDEAIEAYETLLKMSADHAQAPEIQEKIVLCYRHKKDDMRAYVSREKLFNEYKPGSPWWQKHGNEKLRDKAYQITERALRDNVNLLFQRAETNRDYDLYLQAVNDSRKYLKAFPADSMAPLIHWNMALTMDARLGQNDQAFEEYMKVCDLYWNSKYQKFASENAIALAKDAAELDTARKVIEQISDQKVLEKEGGILSVLEYRRMELTDSEKRLIRAYNNYIKLYPHAPETATILANAGAIYYNNNQFGEALRYFNTIVKHFADNKDIDYVKYTIMESYFGKHDFKSAEIVARRLKNTENLSPELSLKAQKRLAESIFLAAQTLSDSADHLQAGNEYLRVSREVPNSEFADLSLFNAALEYDKAKEYSRAVETYSYLIETRGNSKYVLDAMNNLAIDYGELSEPKNAALTYERLAGMAKNSDQTHDALYNSSLYFVKAEEWEDAIRINSIFVERFPNSEDSDDLFYDVATYYLKLDELDKANTVYGEYAKRYPTSPRVVETYFHRGEFFETKEELDKAMIEYRQAISRNEEFHKNNLETNDYYAAESLFRLTRINHFKYRQVEFVLPLARMEQDKKKKRDMLIEVVDGYTKIASFGTLRLYEATYYIGEAYEDFAASWVRQELPVMEETRRIITKKNINETAAELYGKAEETYKQSMKILTRLADEYEKSLMSTDSLGRPTLDNIKLVKEDSTLRVARKWIDRSKEKISESIYDIAELNLSTVNAFLSAPIPEGLSSIAEMEYRRQILGKAIAPLIQNIIDAHIRNVRESWTLGLENQWVKLSRQKSITTGNLLAAEYNNLANKSLDLYCLSVDNFIAVVDQKASTPEEFDLVSLSDQMANLNDFSKAFAKVAVDMSIKTLQKAQEENIVDPTVAETKERMLESLYEITQKCNAIAATSKFHRKNYEKLYKDTKKINYEEAFFTFEDSYFSIKETTRELLELGYQVSRDRNISNSWATKILLALVQENPDKYSSLLNLQPKTDQYVTNTSWNVSNRYVEDWIKPEYDVAQWQFAQYVDKSKNTVQGNLVPVWLTAVDTINFLNSTPGKSELDSLAQISNSMNADSAANLLENRSADKVPDQPVNNKRLYFRKKFAVIGLPVSADIKVMADDSYNLFLNGEYIASFTTDDSVWQREHFHQLSDNLVEGENTLAIECIDNDGTQGGLVAIVNIKYLPGWHDKKQQIQLETSDDKIKQNLIMDKYIILSH